MTHDATSLKVTLGKGASYTISLLFRYINNYIYETKRMSANLEDCELILIPKKAKMLKTCIYEIRDIAFL